jgi:hypothetical protein
MPGLRMHIIVSHYLRIHEQERPRLKKPRLGMQTTNRRVLRWGLMPSAAAHNVGEVQAKMTPVVIRLSCYGRDRLLAECSYHWLTTGRRQWLPGSTGPAQHLLRLRTRAHPSPPAGPLRPASSRTPGPCAPALRTWWWVMARSKNDSSPRAFVTPRAALGDRAWIPRTTVLAEPGRIRGFNKTKGPSAAAKAQACVCSS